MRFALEQGDIDEFAELLNQHWKLSCMLDAGTTNTCIDQILLVCEDLVDGKFISRSRWRRIHSGDSKERCAKRSCMNVCMACSRTVA